MNREIALQENERLDDLQNGYFIIQNTKNFCYGIDAVLLAGFARVKAGAGYGHRHRDHSHPSESKNSGGAFYRAGDPGGERPNGPAQCGIQRVGEGH